jgi:hypothetical protein
MIKTREELAPSLRARIEFSEFSQVFLLAPIGSVLYFGTQCFEEHEEQFIIFTKHENS